MIFIKSQFIYLILLYFVFVIPLGLFFQFSPYPLPKVQYFIIGVLYLSNYVFFKESKYRTKIERKVINQLTSEKGKTPSKNQIIARVNLLVTYRVYSLVITVVGILGLMIYYGEF